jgi:hypothetical protein
MGIVLDAAALLGLCTLLDRAGALGTNVEAWLLVTALMAVPWYVHVVGLPIICRLSSIRWMSVARLSARGMVFIAGAAVLVPLLGIVAFTTIAPIIFVATGSLPTKPELTFSLADQFRDNITWMLMAGLVGAAIGAVLHGLRPDTFTHHTRDARQMPLCGPPSVCSDIFGGALAAFLALGGMYVAIALGLFFRPVVMPGGRGWTGNLLATPQFSSLVLIGTVALLPHLLMSGIDLRRPRVK